MLTGTSVLTTTVARAICVTAAAALAIAAAGCSSPAEKSTSEPVVTVTPQGAPTVKPQEVSGMGTILVNGRGMALYFNSVDSRTTFKCVGECATEWPPVKVPSGPVARKLAGVSGTFSVVTRPDGTKQLAVDGHPLYTFVEDRSPGMVRGNGFVDEGSGTELTWHVATPSGVAPHSSASPSDSMSPSPR